MSFLQDEREMEVRNREADRHVRILRREQLQCDMSNSCTTPPTHIGEKGFIYCGEHALVRREGGRERCRKMRAWEIDLIAQGKPLPSYKPVRKPLPALAKPAVEAIGS